MKENVNGLKKMNKREEVMALIDEILASGVSPETITAELAKAVEEVEHGQKEMDPRTKTGGKG